MENTLEMRVKEAFADETFIKELFALEAPEDAQTKLKEKGIVLTLDEVKSIGRALQRANENNDELSEEALEDVAGGVLTEAAAIVIAGCIGGGTSIIVAGIHRWGW